MYKCSECGAEYEKKPDYCDCGNDEFEEITPAEPALSDIQQEKVEPLPAKNFNNNKVEYRKKTFSEQYPALTRFIESIDPISGGIFTLCIILSFVVIFCLWNVDENNITSSLPSPQNEEASSKNIPSIDKFWNNTPPAQKIETKQEEIKPVQVVQEVVRQIIPVQTKKQTVQKTQPVSKQKNTAQKPATPKTSTNTNKSNIKPVTTQHTVQKTATSTPVQVKNEPQKSGTTTVQLQKVSTASTIEQVNTSAQKKELENYKAGLRNTIGRKIDFTKVIGDGNCIVAFKINSSGKLVNRSFAQQSSNITLNDAVYAAVMSTPLYNPPPSGYKDETLYLNIKFYNGNFEISLK